MCLSRIKHNKINHNKINHLYQSLLDISGFVILHILFGLFRVIGQKVCVTNPNKLENL